MNKTSEPGQRNEYGDWGMGSTIQGSDLGTWSSFYSLHNFPLKHENSTPRHVRQGHYHFSDVEFLIYRIFNIQLQAKAFEIREDVGRHR